MNANNILHFKVRMLKVIIGNALSLNIFKKNNLKFMKPTTINIFSCQNLKDIWYLTTLRLGLSHLHEHKFKNNFQDTLNPNCNCGYDVENICHFPLAVLTSSMKETLFLTKLIILIVTF